MQERTTIARPYAQAAFEFAVEQGVLEEWSEAIHLLGLMISDPQMHNAINDPKVSNEKLVELVNSIAGDTFNSAEIKNFIKVLVENERLQFAPEMARLFEDLVAEKKGIAEVSVISAHGLSDDETSNIAATMKKRLGKEVEINSSVDESLIGGAIIRVGDMMIDASVRGRLQTLTNNIT